MIGSFSESLDADSEIYYKYSYYFVSMIHDRDFFMIPRHPGFQRDLYYYNLFSFLMMREVRI